MLRRVLANVSRRSYAKVTAPAPAFAGPAVVNGAFEEISLEKYTSEVNNKLHVIIFEYLNLGQMGLSFLLPFGFHFRLSN